MAGVGKGSAASLHPPHLGDPPRHLIQSHTLPLQPWPVTEHGRVPGPGHVCPKKRSFVGHLYTRTRASPAERGSLELCCSQSLFLPSTPSPCPGVDAKPAWQSERSLAHSCPLTPGSFRGTTPNRFLALLTLSWHRGLG